MSEHNDAGGSVQDTPPPSPQASVITGEAHKNEVEEEEEEEDDDAMLNDKRHNLTLTETEITLDDYSPTANNPARSSKSRMVTRAKAHSWCRWPTLLFLAVLMAIGGFLLWFYLPQDVKTSTGRLFNQTRGEADDDWWNRTAAPVSPSAAPTMAPRYDFMQCSPNAERCCNGLETICDLRVEDIMFATVHNAMSSVKDKFFVAPNNDLPLELALEAGYRGINIDIGKCLGTYKLIHAQCVLGSRDPVEVFTNINQFLTDNPTEVVMIALQITDSGDTVVLSEIYDDVISQVDGLVDRIYVHDDGTPNSARWPTLQTLIDADTRILLFHFNGPTCEETYCPPGFHDYFEYVAESEFVFADVAQVENTTLACAATRGATGYARFYGVNQFLEIAARDASATMNALDFVTLHTRNCSDYYDGVDVNMVLVDFWDKGNLPEFTQLHNQKLGLAALAAASNSSTTSSSSALAVNDNDATRRHQRHLLRASDAALH